MYIDTSDNGTDTQNYPFIEDVPLLEYISIFKF